MTQSSPPTDRLTSPSARAYEASRLEVGDATLLLERGPFGKRLIVAAPPESPALAQFEGVLAGGRAGADGRAAGVVVKRCPTNASNAASLRGFVRHLAPTPLHLATSAGFGDRLGSATPGHARALEAAVHGAGGAQLAPIFAQQSIREMTRTGRSPRDVLDDATWGAFEAGWRGPVGADADHLKAPEHIDACVAAGFSFFTIDPGDHVDDGAHDADEAGVSQRLGALPWDALETSHRDMETLYVGRTVDLGTRELTLEREAVLRAAAKYGRALAHVARMYRHLAGQLAAFDFEVSVDETGTPTSPAEHAFVALELRRLGVTWVSLAPRFPGRFEKGVDYIGDTAELAAELAWHAAIARALGPYKLSLHSGSDKFSVYAPFVEATGGLAHLKTAGTSYLEALRVVAHTAPRLFREILAFARIRFPEDRASYHISAELAKVPLGIDLADEALAGLLDQFDARQVLHVTFGSVLEAYGDAIRSVLDEHEEQHYQALSRHFLRHLRPFAEGAARARGGRS